MVLLKQTASVSREELTGLLRKEGLMNVREVLPGILTSMVKAGKVFIHLRRGNGRQPTETFFRQRCTEDIPADFLALIPDTGINRDGLRQKAKVTRSYSRSETDLAIDQLCVQGSIEEREVKTDGKGQAKKLFFKC